MELRQTRQRRENNDFRELKITLSGYGLYEDGMKMEEMLAIMDALQESVTQNETNLDMEMEKALRESELDFGPGMLNSTTISASNHRRLNAVKNNSSTSPFSSPEESPKIITVQALVHHSIDWSPLPSRHSAISVDSNRSNLEPLPRLQRKRIYDATEDSTHDCIDVSRSNSSSHNDSGFNFSDSGVLGASSASSSGFPSGSDSAATSCPSLIRSFSQEQSAHLSLGSSYYPITEDESSEASV